MSIQVSRRDATPALTSRWPTRHPLGKTHQLASRQLQPRTRTRHTTGGVANGLSGEVQGAAARCTRRLTTHAILGGSPRSRQVVPRGGAGNQKFLFFFDASNHTVRSVTKTDYLRNPVILW